MNIDIKVLLDGCKRILLLAVLAVGFATLSAAPTYASSAGAVWGKDYFPNYELTAHTGETLRFFDDVIEGKVVAVNFIFTSCKDVCPMETARMASVYEILGDRVAPTSSSIPSRSILRPIRSKYFVITLNGLE